MFGSKKLLLILVIAIAFVVVSMHGDEVPPATRPSDLKSGKIERIEDHTLIIRRAQQLGGGLVSYKVDDSASVIVDHEPARFSDLKKGMSINVIQQRAIPGGPLTPVLLAMSPGIAGTIVAIHDDTLTIQTGGSSDSKTIDVKTDDKTHFIRSPRVVNRHLVRQQINSVSDLAVGMSVRVSPPTGVAARVWVLVPRPTTATTRSGL